MCRAGGPRCDGKGRRNAAKRPPDSGPYGEGRTDAELERIAREYAATDDDKTYEVITSKGTRATTQGINSAKALAGKDGSYQEKKAPAVAPAKATVPSREDADRLAADMPARRKDAFGQVLSEQDRRLFALRESGYTGPIGQDGYPDTTSESAGILRHMAHQRGEAVSW